MTIGTISLGVGLNNLGANGSHLVDKHNDGRQNSAGVSTPTADAAQPRVIAANAAAVAANQALANQTRVTPVVVNGLGLGLKFSTDQQTGTPIITVVDTESGEVVRQIPDEEVLAFMHLLEDDKGALLSVKL